MSSTLSPLMKAVGSTLGEAFLTPSAPGKLVKEGGFPGGACGACSSLMAFP